MLPRKDPQATWRLSTSLKLSPDLPQAQLGGHQWARWALTQETTCPYLARWKGLCPQTPETEAQALK